MLKNTFIAILSSAVIGYIAVCTAAPDIVLFDFEGNSPLQGWKSEGDAFFVAEATAPYHGKIRIENVQGGHFLYSFDTARRTNTPVGSLTSPEFVIERDYINFFLGGGRGFPDRIGAQLLVDGKVVRSSTGRESRPGISLKLVQLSWEVRAFRGKTARIVFQDRTPYGTTAADHFVMSDTPQGYRSDATVRFAEMYRPAFHATAARGRSGDANGLFYYNGLWHMGCQLHYVDGGATGWGHSVSKDLVHWTVLDDMIPVGLDGAAFSGGATVDHLNTSGLKNGKDDPILLFYTLLPPGSGGAFPDTPYSKAPKAADIRYRPAIAYSTDGGMSFVKTTDPVFQYGNPRMLTYDKRNKYTLDGGKTWVGDPSTLLGSGGFGKDRDGKVFYYEPTKDWIMIWHLSQNNNRPNTSFGLYRTKDFKKWELFQTIPCGMWECPDMFEMPAIDRNGKPTGQRYWIINRGGVEYLIGTFDGNEFCPISANDPSNPYESMRISDPRFDTKRFLRRVTYKSGYYAAQTFANAPENRIVQVSWMSENKVSDNMPGSPWENMMSFPVELTLRDTGKGLVLEHMPAREIQQTYTAKHERRNLPLADGVTKNLVPIKSGLLDIDVTFDAGDAREFGLTVLGETITYKVRERQLWAFRSLGEDGVDWTPKFTTVPLEDNKISLRILVDRCSVEVSINQGIYRTTAIVYPQNDDVALDFFSRGATARIESLSVREIESEQRACNTQGIFSK